MSAKIVRIEVDDSERGVKKKRKKKRKTSIIIDE